MCHTFGRMGIKVDNFLKVGKSEAFGHDAGPSASCFVEVSIHRVDTKGEKKKLRKPPKRMCPSIRMETHLTQSTVGVPPEPKHK